MSQPFDTSVGSVTMGTRLVLVLRDDLPQGLAVNAAAVLTLSLGGQVSDSLGPDGKDASGGAHPGLNTHPVPVLVAPSDRLRELRDRAMDSPDLRVVAFSEVARRARDYGSYLRALSTTPDEEIDYVGVILHGPKSQVTKLTKHLALMG
jgi:hypothetical protein